MLTVEIILSAKNAFINLPNDEAPCILDIWAQ